ncbi:MAG: DUF3784 domain-containing protein [Lachnospiraceae bacterium]
MQNIIGGVALGIVALVCFILGIRHLMEKGFLLNNAYLYASKEEREAMNKKPYYRQSGIILILLGIVFTFNAVAVLLENVNLSYIAIAVIGVVLIYAIASTVKIEHTK